MECTMKSTNKLPKIDSIRKLAEFWDTHDVTEFEGQLVEVTENVFERKKIIPLRLGTSEARALGRIAKAKGIADEELVHRWIREKINTN